MPKYEIIKYFWKWTRPLNDDDAEDLINAAYTTAKKADPAVSEILIRSGIHSTTWATDRYVPDRPHITVSTKTPRQVRERKHRSLHGYTRGKNDYKILEATPNEAEKDDGATWPNGLRCEERDYRVK